MDRSTLAVYDAHAHTYLRNRGKRDQRRAGNFARAVAAGAPRLDLGCGPGHYLDLLGGNTVGLDGSSEMLAEARRRRRAPLVRADLAKLPFRRASFGGVWASKCLQHVPAPDLPLALAELHHALVAGGRLDIVAFSGSGVWVSDGDLPGRSFTLWEPQQLADLLEGAGFKIDQLDHEAPSDSPAGSAPARYRGTIAVSATRMRSLPDVVGPRMRLLVCGLNPSLYAADAGVGFARPGNRFWPALRAAGLVPADLDRDAGRLLRDHRIGMTDLVKRATANAAEVTRDEYRHGLERVERLCRWLEPAAVCFVGLAGWRIAAQPRAAAGWQPQVLGGVPVYVMPSTSGLNAKTPLDVLARHLAEAVGIDAADGVATPGGGGAPRAGGRTASATPRGGQSDGRAQ